MKIEFGYAQHLGNRREQQDAAVILSNDENELLVVVADGMGGHSGGALASTQVTETAKHIWARHSNSRMEPRRLLENILVEAHEAINKAGMRIGAAPHSTCAALFVNEGIAHWGHVGDTRIYRVRDGQVTRLTKDHSVVQMLVDLGKVAEEEMAAHPDQNCLVQSLGGDGVPVPDFGCDSVRPHDAFLVCSDGLWQTIPQTEMAMGLAAANLGDQSAQNLANQAFERAKPNSDNISVAVLRVGGREPCTIVHPVGRNV